MPSSTDRIEKQIELNAPVARVWRALTDHVQFGSWFGANFSAPFAPGTTSRATMKNPKYSHIVVEFFIKELKPESYFSYEWHPFPMDTSVDYTKETPTLVEFRFTKSATGTLLTVTESGFDQLPAHRRDEAFRMNTGGWEAQMKNVAKYVDANP